MTVNDLARRVGIPAHVVRYYTQRGLLRPARNSRNAYREYADADLHRLKFVCCAKTIGFTLKEVSDILHAVDSGVALGPELKQLVQVRAQQIELKLAAAQGLLQRIRDAVDTWNSAPGEALGSGHLQRLIDAVANEQ
ncbi:MAG: MerR family transcriptional regulator [Gammaproteobacteria bacterium]